MKKDNIPPQIYERVENELLAGEDLLWVGQTRGNFGILSMQTGPYRTLAVPVLFIGFLMTLVAALIQSPLLQCLIVLIIIPLFWLWYKINSSTIYAITNHRALILLYDGSVQSYGPQAVRHIERKERPDGRGDLIFKTGSVEVGFFGIEHVRQVEALLLKTFYTPPGDGAQDNFRPPPPRQR